MRARHGLPLVPCIVLGCLTAVGPDDLRGAWGAEGAQLTVEGGQAQFVTSCSHGTFLLPGRLTKDGRFEVTGTTVSVGGPPPTEPRVASPARFAGQLTGPWLTITVDPENPLSESWLLRKGVRVDVPGCP